MHGTWLLRNVQIPSESAWAPVRVVVSRQTGSARTVTGSWASSRPSVRRTRKVRTRKAQPTAPAGAASTCSCLFAQGRQLPATMTTKPYQRNGASAVGARSGSTEQPPEPPHPTTGVCVAAGGGVEVPVAATVAEGVAVRVDVCVGVALRGAVEPTRATPPTESGSAVATSFDAVSMTKRESVPAAWARLESLLKTKGPTKRGKLAAIRLETVSMTSRPDGSTDCTYTREPSGLKARMLAALTPGVSVGRSRTPAMDARAMPKASNRTWQVRGSRTGRYTRVLSRETEN